MKREGVWKQLWFFLWESESPWSWLLDLIIAFVAVRFIIFPVLGFLLATTLPLVVVESGSMEHNNLNFDSWWEENGQWYEDNKNITKETFAEYDLPNGFDKGDVIITKGREKYNPGDVIIFTTYAQRTPIIHRVVEYNRNFKVFETKGDNNALQLVYEKSIPTDAVISEALIRIPKIGWIKLAFVELFRALAN